MNVFDLITCRALYSTVIYPERIQCYLIYYLPDTARQMSMLVDWSLQSSYAFGKGFHMGVEVAEDLIFKPHCHA